MVNADQTMSIEIDNLKCGGCSNTIIKGLTLLAGVTDVAVDQEKSAVSFVADDSKLSTILAKLKAMGYPQKGSTHGFESSVATAKSFVSCAVGRLT